MEERYRDNLYIVFASFCGGLPTEISGLSPPDPVEKARMLSNCNLIEETLTRLFAEVDPDILLATLDDIGDVLAMSRLLDKYAHREGFLEAARCHIPLTSRYWRFYRENLCLVDGLEVMLALRDMGSPDFQAYIRGKRRRMEHYAEELVAVVRGVDWNKYIQYSASVRFFDIANIHGYCDQSLYRQAVQHIAKCILAGGFTGWNSMKLNGVSNYLTREQRLYISCQRTLTKK